jgi:hypothetical protein
MAGFLSREHIVARPGYIRDYQIDHGVHGAQIYNVTMYILAALLAGGLLCNLLVNAVHERYHMADSAAYGATAAQPGLPEPVASQHQTAGIKVVCAWLIVWLPIAWGIWVTLQKAVVLFR